MCYVTISQRTENGCAQTKWFFKILQERFTALADILQSQSYDVVVLQEVWFQRHYDIIKDTMPYVSPFRGEIQLENNL